MKVKYFSMISEGNTLRGFIFIGLPRSLKETKKYIASYKNY